MSAAGRAGKPFPVGRTAHQLVIWLGLGRWRRANPLAGPPIGRLNRPGPSCAVFSETRTIYRNTARSAGGGLEIGWGVM